MSELTDQVVRDLKDRLGHGGYCCSMKVNDRRYLAQYECKVPWKECIVRVSVPQKGWIGIRITVYQADLTRRRRRTFGTKTAILEWGYEHSMFDPEFNPDHIVGNIADAIIHIKNFFKAHRDATAHAHGWSTMTQSLAAIDMKAKVDRILGHLGQAPVS